MRIRKIKVISVIHNHPTFKSDNSELKHRIGLLIVTCTIFLSNEIIFTSPHIKRKWAKTRIFQFYDLSSKSRAFRRLFAFNDYLSDKRNIKDHSIFKIDQKRIIDIYSWGRATPYKDLSILYKIFSQSQNHINPKICLNIIHYGVTSSKDPIFVNYQNLGSQFSIINRRPSFEELDFIHSAADYIIFPYKDMSQSGPMRLSRELGSNILVPILDGSIEQLGDYKYKFLFDPNNLDTLFNYLNNNFYKR